MITVEKTSLKGVLKVHLGVFVDHRGHYIETYNEKLYREQGIDIKFVQDDASMSTRGVLRGIHGDDQTWKLISCLLGKIYLVVVNCDIQSPQCNQWESFVLTENNGLQVLVPPKHGVAHLVLSDKAIFHYKQSEYYSPERQFTYKWNDKRFEIWWPVKEPILSRRDEEGQYNRVEAGRKLGLSNKGRQLSDEARKNISNGLKGCKPWNKGLSKETHPSIARQALAVTGHVPWNKGETGVYSAESLQAITIAQRNRRQREGSFQTEDAIKLYIEGKGCNEIAHTLNSTYSSVWRRLQALGILRDRGCANRGKKLSEETRNRMSSTWKAKFEDDFQHEMRCGRNNPFYGKKHKPESIEQMKRKLSQLLSGANNPQWLGGVSFEPYGLEFNDKLRERIRERDNYQCQGCGIPEI